MTCDELRDLFELYSLDLLESDEKHEIEAHLSRGCENCERNLRSALALNSLFVASAPSVIPPAKLKRRVLASIGVEKSSWTWLAALAAAGMLVVALWISVQERARTEELAEVRRTLSQVDADRNRLEQALAFLNQPETRQVRFGVGEPTPPRGNVLVNPQLGVLFIASNLPPLPAGRTYEFWVIPQGTGAAPRPAGLFQATQDRTALHIVRTDASNLAAIAVSVEPEAGSPAPTTTPIIIAPVGGA